MRKGWVLGAGWKCDQPSSPRKIYPFMSYAKAPLISACRRSLVQRCQTRPIAHVAAEASASRACLSKWKNRYDRSGEAGLHDRASDPHASPTQTPPEVGTRIEELRRKHKWSAARIALEFASEGHRARHARLGAGSKG